MDNQESSWQLKIVIGIIIVASIIISALSLLISLGQAVTNMMSLGGTADATDYLLLAGIFNFIVVLPLLFFFVKKKYGKSYRILIVIPLIPIALIVLNMVYQSGSITIEPYSRAEEVNKITDQIQLARDANITVDSFPYEVTEFKGEFKNTYVVIVPIKINNLPTNLEKFNLNCRDFVAKNNQKVQKDPSGYSVSCDLSAVQTNSGWEYTYYDHSAKVVKTKDPVLYISYESRGKVVVPEYISTTIHLYILGPLSDRTNDWLIKDTTIVDLKLNLTKKK